MIVFDEIPRDLHGPATGTESYFEYLNRSPRSEAQSVRQLIEHWVSLYPEDDRQSLVSRLRSEIDDELKSAFFELYLHRIFESHGNKLVAVEPELEGTSKRPDFLFESEGGESFYVEAVLATGRNPKETGAERRKSAVLNAINSVNAIHHFLDIRHEGAPKQSPRLKPIRQSVQNWVDELGVGKQSAASLNLNIDGMALKVAAIPRKKPSSDGGAIGMYWPGAFVAGPGDGIRQAVKYKAKRYGQMDKPFIVAVNSLIEHHNEEDAIDAAFGSPCVVVNVEDPDIEPRASRNPDGVWIGRNGPAKKQLSAILSFDRLTPWSVAQRRARLIINPWAEHPLPQINLPVDRIESQSQGKNFVLQKVEGDPLSSLFNLYEGWPEARG